MKTFNETLNYTSCNEDWRAEYQALKIGEGDIVFCITGSGDRPLNLLTQNPKKIITLDCNPVQNYLLRLKMTAMQVLPYDEYVAFIGLRDSEGRLDTWRKIKSSLPDDCIDYWSENEKVIMDGLLYQGRWEKYFSKLAWVSNLIRGKAINKLFGFESIDTQRRFILTEWDLWWWRLIFRFLFSKWFSQLFFGDPGFYQHVSDEKKIGGYIFDRLKNYLSSHLARDSFMVRLAFTGKFSEGVLPPYLDSEGVQVIKKSLDRVDLCDGNVVEVLESIEANSISRFSLSDTPSFFDQTDFERMLDGIVRAATDKARFCIRIFLSSQTIPARFDGVLVREPDLEQILYDEDSSIAYSFIVGTVNKGN